MHTKKIGYVVVQVKTVYITNIFIFGYSGYQTLDNNSGQQCYLRLHARVKGAAHHNHSCVQVTSVFECYRALARAGVHNVNVPRRRH